jgi:hypothetical protein
MKKAGNEIINSIAVILSNFLAKSACQDQTFIPTLFGPVA